MATGAFSALARLWRHPLFRKLVGVRVATQTADGTLQLAMASYILLSPQNAPNAWAMAGVLAITLLPFSIIGPFVSVVLDRWSRQRVVVVVDSARAAIAVSIALVITSGASEAVKTSSLLALMLVAMSLNRFLLAGLSAGLPHTVEPDEYLAASSVMPVIGPMGVMIGAALATGGRLVLAQWLPTNQADAVVFTIAGLLFCCSVAIASTIGRDALGPDERVSHGSVREVVTGLVEAVSHLRSRPHAALGITVIGAQRLLFGIIMVATILGFRNYFHDTADVTGATADLGLWAGITGAGFVCSVALTPQLSRHIGLRRAGIALLAAAAIVQCVPGSIFIKESLLVASGLLGLFSQSFKIVVDTLVQSHIDDVYKGRVFVIYDMVFNAALVLAAVIAALLLPTWGFSLPAFIGVGVGYALLAVFFAVASRRIGADSFERGTESVGH